MNVRSYLIILILGYSICGLTVFFLLHSFHQGEAQLADSVNRSRLLLRDVDSLKKHLSHWLLLSDLVLGSDQSYLCDGALQLGQEFDASLQSMEVSSKYHGSVSDIQKFSDRQKDRLHKSRSFKDSDRASELNLLLLKMDEDSESTIANVESLEQVLEQEFRQFKSQRDVRTANRSITIAALLVGFLFCALMLWLWISAILSQPISTLARQSEIKDGTVRSFEVKSTAPKEVRQLAVSLSELVDDLEFQIEDHKKTEVERAKLHRNLMDASRRAGMADVASEVLHNVGNVLNSINVSATVIQNSLRESLLPKLALANRRFAQHEGDYGHYLKNDEKGKHFPAALDYMTDALVSDRNAHLNEAEQLIKNISHMRYVIQRQLSLSRSDGLIETFCLCELIDESVSINNSKANRFGAFVKVDCPATLNLVTDRHKLQQILINLISNALDAVAENRVNSGRVEVLVNRKFETVEITVSDNGIGIPAENLADVFQQGFTTKEHGHGFGLHSCAMTAQVLGGILNVTSKGPGQGASFQLVIPLSQSGLCKI